MASRKWYAEGLSFECTQCGNCCSGPPGYVWVNKNEIARIARFLGRSDGWLPKNQLRRVGFRHSLTERQDGDCIFLRRNEEGAQCSIYEVRPLQCRTWPFWSGNLRSLEAWNATARTCPGVNRGAHYDFVAVEDVRLKKSW